MTQHQKYIARCLELAKNGLGTTYPNPLVGSVVVYKDTIIGEGWHKKAGEAHAEVNAINSVKDKSLLSKATIYVNLEPCSHFGKTPPCCDLIIKHKIPEVVVGTADPFAAVAGAGIERLKAAGVNVIVGVLEDECLFLNRRFFTVHEKKRPFIILKWAESADGFIAPEQKNDRKPVWISNVYSRQIVHKWRTEEAAVLVGTQTAIDDNPQLTSRDWQGNQPVRVVFDFSAKIPTDSHLFDNQQKTIVICLKQSKIDKENIIFETIDPAEKTISQVLQILMKHEIQSVIIEGGLRTLQSFIDDDLWDEARIFIGSTNIIRGTKAPRLPGFLLSRQSIDNDQLLTFRNYDKHDHI